MTVQAARVKKIFVGGIPTGADNDDVKKYFTQYGTVGLSSECKDCTIIPLPGVGNGSGIEV